MIFNLKDEEISKYNNENLFPPLKSKREIWEILRFTFALSEQKHSTVNCPLSTVLTTFMKIQHL